MRFFFLLVIVLSLQSCAPPIMGGIGAIAFSSSAQEKGLGTSINDKVIYVKLRNAIFDWEPSVAKAISISVNDGSILVTGNLNNIDEIILSYDLISKKLDSKLNYFFRNYFSSFFNIFNCKNDYRKIYLKVLINTVGKKILIRRLIIDFYRLIKLIFINRK